MNDQNDSANSRCENAIAVMILVTMSGILGYFITLLYFHGAN